jgi:hypothetical protein
MSSHPERPSPGSLPRPVGLLGLLSLTLLLVSACGEEGEGDALQMALDMAADRPAVEQVSGSEGNDPEIGSFAIRFEGALTGEYTQASDGRASHHVNVPEAYCAAAVGGPMGGTTEELRAFIFYFGGTACPEPGRYTVVSAQTSTPGEVWVLLSVAGPQFGAFTGSSGTVEVVAANATEMRYTLSVELANAMAPGESTRVTGEVTSFAQIGVE